MLEETKVAIGHISHQLGSARVPPVHYRKIKVCSTPNIFSQILRQIFGSTDRANSAWVGYAMADVTPPNVWFAAALSWLQCQAFRTNGLLGRTTTRRAKEFSVAKPFCEPCLSLSFVRASLATGQPLDVDYQDLYV